MQEQQDTQAMRDAAGYVASDIQDAAAEEMLLRDAAGYVPSDIQDAVAEEMLLQHVNMAEGVDARSRVSEWNGMEWNERRARVSDEIVLPEEDLLEQLMKFELEKSDDASAATPPRPPSYLQVIAEQRKRLAAKPAPEPAAGPPLHHCHSVICHRRVQQSARLHKLAAQRGTSAAEAGRRAADLKAALCVDDAAVTADPNCDLGWLQRGLTQYSLERYAAARASFATVATLTDADTAAQARSMIQRLDALDAEQQAIAAKRKHKRRRDAVQRRQKMAAAQVQWSARTPDGEALVFSRPGDRDGFIRARRLKRHDDHGDGSQSPGQQQQQEEEEEEEEEEEGTLAEGESAPA
jgi:hypothetical protein